MTFLGVSRSAYYAWIKRMDRPDPDQERMQLVLEAYERSRKTYGYRTDSDLDREGTWYQDQSQSGPETDEKAQYSFCCQKKESLPAHTKIDMELIHTYPNLMGQNFKSNGPNQKWGTDITYIPTQQGFVYLAIIKDFFDGTILGHALSRNYLLRWFYRLFVWLLNFNLKGVILQSDQGSQFQSSAYRALTSQLGIIPSMSEKGTAWITRQLKISFPI